MVGASTAKNKKEMVGTSLAAALLALAACIVGIEGAPHTLREGRDPREGEEPPRIRQFARKLDVDLPVRLVRLLACRPSCCACF